MEQANTKPPHNHGQICAKCGWAFYGHMRDDAAAHPQMREIAGPLHEEFKRRNPYVFQ